jgi:hypothetical protein
MVGPAAATFSNREQSVAIDVKFHHIGITVTSLERTLEFFEDAFGLVTGMALEVKAGGPARTRAARGPARRR